MRREHALFVTMAHRVLVAHQGTPYLSLRQLVLDHQQPPRKTFFRAHAQLPIAAKERSERWFSDLVCKQIPSQQQWKYWIVCNPIETEQTMDVTLDLICYKTL